MVLFGLDIRIYFLVFIIYSFFGWVMEVVGKLIQYKRFINRGFLIGPVCPIYGWGAILITLLLNKYTNDPIVLFFMAIIICGTLEYLTSFFMEKIYHARWWDYSQKKFNINGRVCLDTIIPFGLLGMFIMYVSNPFLFKQLESMPETALNITFWVILAILIIDGIVSGKVIGTISSTTKKIGKELDNTEEITKKVKEIILGKSAVYRRILKAYPDIQSIKVKIKEKKEDIKRQVTEQTQELKRNIKEKVGDMSKEDKKEKNEKNS